METMKRIKQQKGITLVEVLAVLVILGILATVAIPAIGSVIDNSKKNSVIATAEQIVAAVKIKEAAGEDVTPGTAIEATDLITQGYLDAPLRDPEKEEWTTATVTVIAATAGNPKEYQVDLTSSNWDINGPKDVADLTKTDVVPVP